MKNIFILYIPPKNYEALVHYQDTITNKVSPDRIYRYVDSHLKNKLKSIFGNRSIATWGSRDSEANRQKYDKITQGDDILIVEGDEIKLLGKIAAKTTNKDLSRELWKNLKGDTTEGWDLIYFIANPLEIGLPFTEFTKLLGYKDNLQLRGFMSVSDERLENFYSRYDDLYSILLRIKKGESVEQKSEPYVKIKEEASEIRDEAPMPQKELSEHIKIQHTLIQLGRKAGSNVWIPKNDQSRITKEYDYDDFEKEFTAGLDVDARYVDNIDVVWKEEFRIDAAFEIENSTEVYSGLLRFSDLKIVAPNSNYPLFIVAPKKKRKQVFDQVKRPTFRQIGFDKKVRYLSYEAINEVDKFFEDNTTGLNIDLLVGKSEIIV